MNRIRELRMKKGWGQKDLAELLNTKYQTVGHYETGRRGLDVETINKLCDIFDCTSDYLLCRSSILSPKLKPEQEAMLLAYECAPAEIRKIVDTALDPYRQRGRLSSGATA